MKPRTKALNSTQKEKYRQLVKDEIAQVRKLVLEGDQGLWHLINEVLWPETADYHYQEDLHLPLAEWVTSKADPRCRKLILMPRRHRKSYIVTIAHCVYRILKDPNVRILVVSAIDQTAKDFLRVVKAIFQNNAGIKKYFSEFHVDPNRQFGTAYQFEHPLRTLNDPNPTLRSGYLGAPLAGKRCDILICDDAIEKAHVSTPEQADKALANFNDLIPLISDHPDYGMVFVIGTRWGFNDIYAALLGENRGEDARSNLQENLRYEAIVRHCLENDAGKPDFENGKPIFHKRFTAAHLKNEVMEEYKNDPKKGEEDFWKQMMNVCVSPSGKKFEEAWFDNWVDRLPGNIVWSGIVIDSATKDEQVIMRGDYTAVHVGHFDAYGHLYLTDALHSDKYKSPDLMRHLCTLAQRHSVFNLVKEKVGEEMFFGMVRASFNSQNMPLTTYPVGVRGQGRKVVRVVESLQDPFMQRRVHFVGSRGEANGEGAWGYPKHIWKMLRDEAVHLGQWAHDDLIDALSLFFHKDVRVRPTSFQSHDWTVPRNARIPQRSAGRVNPASLSNWNTRMTPTESGDGTAREDPFMAQIGKVGDASEHWE